MYKIIVDSNKILIKRVFNKQWMNTPSTKKILFQQFSKKNKEFKKNWNKIEIINFLNSILIIHLFLNHYLPNIEKELLSTMIFITLSKHIKKKKNIPLINILKLTSKTNKIIKTNKKIKIKWIAKIKIKKNRYYSSMAIIKWDRKKMNQAKTVQEQKSIIYWIKEKVLSMSFLKKLEKFDIKYILIYQERKTESKVVNLINWMARSW